MDWIQLGPWVIASVSLTVGIVSGLGTMAVYKAQRRTERPFFSIERAEVTSRSTDGKVSWATALRNHGKTPADHICVSYVLVHIGWGEKLPKQLESYKNLPIAVIAPGKDLFGAGRFGTADISDVFLYISLSYKDSLWGTTYEQEYYLCLPFREDKFVFANLTDATLVHSFIEATENAKA